MSDLVVLTEEERENLAPYKFKKDDYALHCVDYEGRVFELVRPILYIKEIDTVLYVNRNLGDVKCMHISYLYRR